ncbi:MAG: hypothetical protein QF565_09155, partial [Arenicellales bacterium]|nr:hypothetical protein [Arenicellales bacterium]
RVDTIGVAIGVRRCNGRRCDSTRVNLLTEAEQLPEADAGDPGLGSPTSAATRRVLNGPGYAFFC